MWCQIQQQAAVPRVRVVGGRTDGVITFAAQLGTSFQAIGPFVNVMDLKVGQIVTVTSRCTAACVVNGGNHVELVTGVTGTATITPQSNVPDAVAPVYGIFGGNANAESVASNVFWDATCKLERFWVESTRTAHDSSLCVVLAFRYRGLPGAPHF